MLVLETGVFEPAPAGDTRPGGQIEYEHSTSTSTARARAQHEHEHEHEHESMQTLPSPKPSAVRRTALDLGLSEPKARRFGVSRGERGEGAFRKPPWKDLDPKQRGALDLGLVDSSRGESLAIHVGRALGTAFPAEILDTTQALRGQ